MLFLKIKQVTINQVEKRCSLRMQKPPLFVKKLYCLGKTKFLNTSKRAFLFSPSSISGSMTVEAAIVLPLFLFFFLNLLFYMEIFHLHGNMTMALREAGIPMSIYGYSLEEQGSIAGVGMSYLYAGSKVRNYLTTEYLNDSPLTKGVNEIQYIHSKIMEKDMIDLVASYRVSPMISLMGFREFYLYNRFYARAWTGYDVTGTRIEEGEEEWVYMTENGQVYHKNRDCTHLQLSIQSVFYENLSGYRNESGGKYYQCEKCPNGTPSSVIYITEQGDRFHTSIDCSGLKRTIRIVKLSEVAGVPPCNRCGG